ncbi:threonine--tRNA ligase [Synergistaceae bacterium OttesenSCG-928-I11]|nr:threonine--tRNA ligase [Synergistaceae bacterium OttesenSCG-928-I11]
MPHYSGPDGSAFDTAEKTTPFDLFKEWDIKGAIAAKHGDEAVDLFKELRDGGSIAPIMPDTPEGLDVLRHSASHLMAQAILRLYPGAKFGVGPSIKDGFYYDVLFPTPISDEDLPRIEAEMKKISKEKLRIERLDLTSKEALARFADDPFKVELIQDLGVEQVSLYGQGEFWDLCRGPHVPNTGYIKHFKLLSLAGAYWRGDEHNVMLTRIYGTAFPTAEELDTYLTRMEEARLRDHRKLGRELDLFSFQPEGPGFPFFHAKGMVLMNNLVEFWRREHVRRGYSEIKTPLILDRELWMRSGHWDHYRENMYFTEIDERPFAIKPMNCPGGILVYKTAKRSYRELPMRVAELGTVHRHERSGVLHGLMRVRCFTQDDAHIYCTREQIGDELKGVMDLAKYVYGVFGFKFSVELSTRPENSMGDADLWDLAERRLQEALEETGTPYRINPGDGAFYGPKIDYHLEDSIGRTWQCGTIQLDFQLPEKFDLTYIGPDGAEHRPVMLHRTILGSLERFIGILVEHFAGAFPYWLAPVQVKIIQVKPEFESYATEVELTLREMGVRVERDARDEKLGKKIRDAQLEKIPYMLVIGGREVDERTVSLRSRSDGDLGSRTLDELKATLEGEFDPTRS